MKKAREREMTRETKRKMERARKRERDYLRAVVEQLQHTATR